MFTAQKFLAHHSTYYFPPSSLPHPSQHTTLLHPCVCESVCVPVICQCVSVTLPKPALKLVVPLPERSSFARWPLPAAAENVLVNGTCPQIEFCCTSFCCCFPSATVVVLVLVLVVLVYFIAFGINARAAFTLRIRNVCRECGCKLFSVCSFQLFVRIVSCLRNCCEMLVKFAENCA